MGTGGTYGTRLAALGGTDERKGAEGAGKRDVGVITKVAPPLPPKDPPQKQTADLSPAKYMYVPIGGRAAVGCVRGVWLSAGENLFAKRQHNGDYVFLVLCG